jgi:hypothetical protein
MNTQKKRPANDRTVPAVITVVLLALSIILYWKSDYTTTARQATNWKYGRL